MSLILERVEQARAGANDKIIFRLPSGWAVVGDVQFLEGYGLLAGRLTPDVGQELPIGDGGFPLATLQAERQPGFGEFIGKFEKNEHCHANRQSASYRDRGLYPETDRGQRLSSLVRLPSSSTGLRTHELEPALHRRSACHGGELLAGYAGVPDSNGRDRRVGGCRRQFWSATSDPSAYSHVAAFATKVCSADFEWFAVTLATSTCFHACRQTPAARRNASPNSVENPHSARNVRS